MDKEKLKIEYRLLNDDDNSPWQPLTNLDELIWNGVFVIRVTGNTDILELPFTIEENGMFTLVVQDYATDSNLQTQRTTIQTITKVEHETGNVISYTRTRRYYNKEHIWGYWIDNKNNNQLRPLFIAAGAEYNSGETDIVRTGNCGEEIIHKSGHYFLNELGDITEDEMTRIYNAGGFIDNNPYYYQNCNIRTTLNREHNGSLSNGIAMDGLFFRCNNLETVQLFNMSQDNGKLYPNTMINTFYGCNSLRKILPTVSFKHISDATKVQNAFMNCTSLESVKINDLTVPLALHYSPGLNKESLMHIIQNSQPVDFITVTLHPETYSRIENDIEILLTLEKNPHLVLITE